MLRSNAPPSGCATITFEEAMRREMEYRKWVERTHPHLLAGICGAPEMQRDVSTGSVPDVIKRKLAPETSVPPQHSSFSCVTGQNRPQNWYPSKKKVKVPHLPSQILQCPRPNVVPSFWCKICKIDCVTEFNFGAHIGGKKHKAKKLEILGKRNAGGPARQSAGNRNPGQNGLAVSGSRNNELNVGSSISAGRLDQTMICHPKAELMEQKKVDALSTYEQLGFHTNQIFQQ